MGATHGVGERAQARDVSRRQRSTHGTSGRHSLARAGVYNLTSEISQNSSRATIDHSKRCEKSRNEFSSRCRSEISRVSIGVQPRKMLIWEKFLEPLWASGGKFSNRRLVDKSAASARGFNIPWLDTERDASQAQEAIFTQGDFAPPSALIDINSQQRRSFNKE